MNHSDTIQKASPWYWSSSTAIAIRGGANIVPDANDGAALGVSGTAWADLFLASGAIVNWAAGDVTLTHSAGTLTLSSGITTGNSILSGSNVQVGQTASLLWEGRSRVGSPSDGTIRFTDNGQTTFSSLEYGPSASATSVKRLLKKVTGLADNTATDVLTVTIPNANHAAGVKLSFLSSNGSTDAFESSRVAEGFVVLARTAGVATVAGVAALDLAQIATVGGGATHTLAYGVSAITGDADATQTFTVQVTVNDSGNVGSNQVVVVAELINAEATGVTIA